MKLKHNITVTRAFAWVTLILALGISLAPMAYYILIS